MNNFVFTTDVSPDYIPHEDNKFPESDAYFLIYSKDGHMLYDAGCSEDSEHDLIMILSSLSNPIITADILDCLPDMLEYGEEIADAVADNLDLKEASRDAYRASPIVHPANIFKQFRQNNGE
jgi:hypothetical protein